MCKYLNRLEDDFGADGASDRRDPLKDGHLVLLLLRHLREIKEKQVRYRWGGLPQRAFVPFGELKTKLKTRKEKSGVIHSRAGTLSFCSSDT